MFEGHLEWTDEQKAVLQTLSLTRMPMGPITFTGAVWFAEDKDGNRFALKIINKGSYEIKALEKLRSLPSPRNRIIPGRFFECQDTYVFVMPFLDSMGVHWAQTVSWKVVLDQIYVLIDAVQFMHENNIAFVDISTENTVWAAEDVSFEGFNIAMGEVFFIDFGSARILPAGPGSGVRIHDIREYGGKWEPSEGFDTVDPYAYDIDSLGVVLGRQFSYIRQASRKSGKIHVPQVWDYMTSTMTAKEPSRRPSIFRVRRQFVALRIWTSCTGWLYGISPRFAENFEYYTWTVISIFIR